MNTFWTAFKIGLVILLGTFLFRCTSLGDQEVRARIRIAAEIATPEGPRIGSGVIETRALKPSWDFTPAIRISVIGEAIPVDLGSRGKLYFTLAQAGYVKHGTVQDKWFGPLSALGRAYQNRGLLPPHEAFVRGEICWWLDDRLCFLEQTARVRKPLTISFSGLPLLVRFTNSTDPGSVEAVAPEDLASAFGKGVSLSKVTAVPTDEPVTFGALSDLTWLAEMLNTGRKTTLNGNPNKYGVTQAPYDPLPKILYARYLSNKD